MKITMLIGSLFMFMGMFNFDLIKNVLSKKNKMESKPSTVNAIGSLHTFKMKALDGKEVNLSKYKGKKVVLINVASKCGFTPQYADWQAFHEKHGDKVVVLGFPANNFMKQEPGTNEDIASFCQKNYGVSFQMFEKVDVLGDKQHPLFQWLSTKEQNGWNDKAPTWNFCKYVVDENGKLTHFFESNIKPGNAQFLKAVGI